MTVLSVSLFVCFPLPVTLGQELLPGAPPSFVRRATEESPSVSTLEPPGTTRTARDSEMQPGQELRNALQELARLAQQARSTNNPLAQELQNAVQRVQRAAGTTLSANPVAPPAIPVANNARNPLNAEREKAYIELARQYFYVLMNTPVDVPATTPAKREFLSAAPLVPAENVEFVMVTEEVEEFVGMIPILATAEETAKSEREEILENFLECMKKISPASQISLIRELIGSAYTKEDLKLLEGLLDEVLTPPTPVNRVPNARQPVPPGPQPRQVNPPPFR